MADVNELIKQGQYVFTQRDPLLRLWQHIAENFYPERADFMASRTLGTEAIKDLATGVPVIMRRELGNAIGSIRPTTKNWFHTRIGGNWDAVGTEGRAWLEWSEGVQRRAMYARTAQLSRATKEADDDFATFGQAAIQVSNNPLRDGLLHRTWHLRDVAWTEDATGIIDTVYRKWTPRAAELAKLFPGRLHPATQQRLAREPNAIIECWHVVLPADSYDLPGNQHAFVSIYLQVAEQHVLEARGIPELGYVIPRWTIIPGSQYATSPATVLALPEARMIQVMTATLIEAGEKALNPAMVAKKKVFGGRFAVYPGGTTWADYSDGRISDHFEVLAMDKNGIPFGQDMIQDSRAQLADAFYANKINLPPPQAGMTAYEVGQRIQDNIRQVAPLFAPLETEYNAPLCELDFSLLMRMGAFGSPYDMPEELYGREIEFSFESPLHDAIEQAKGQSFLEMQEYLTSAAQIDPSVVHTVDMPTAFRDVLLAKQTPAKWLRSVSEAQARADAQAEAQAELQAQEMLAKQPQRAAE